MAERRERSRNTASTESPGTHSAWRSPGFLLWHVTLRWQRELAAALRPLGLTHVQFVLLGSVWWLEQAGEAPSQAELADHAGTDVMMTSQVVRTLESRELLVRTPDRHDRRVKRVTTTTAGRRLARRAVKVADRVDVDFFGPGDRDELLAVLRPLTGRDDVVND